ncbi:hypothetical protein D3C85_840380 [compost metagenome]
MRIRGRSALGQLRLGLKQQGDWFVLQGGIDLDDGKVLQLRQLLELLKASPGRFVNLGDRDWLALDDRLRRQLEELGGLAERVTDRGLQLSTLSAPLLETLAGEAGAFEADSHWRAHLERLAAMRSHQPQVPRTLQARLRDYQLEGFCWLSRLAHWGVGACLADDMGLGKTVQILALLLERSPQGPQLVVAPTSVTLNWRAECARFAPGLRTRLYHETRNLEDLGPQDLLIVSYGLLQQDSEAFSARRWSSVVLDEAQAIKNAQTKRSQAAMALQADFRMVATGTPLENHLGELWNLFRFINPGLLGSQESFTARFATPIEQGDRTPRPQEADPTFPAAPPEEPGTGRTAAAHRDHLPGAALGRRGTSVRSATPAGAGHYRAGRGGRNAPPSGAGRDHPFAPLLLPPFAVGTRQPAGGRGDERPTGCRGAAGTVARRIGLNQRQRRSHTWKA